MEEFIKSEKVEYKQQKTIKAHLLNVLMANLIYIILWIAFDIFFVYIISSKAISQQFWFILITIAGLNLLVVWCFVFKTLKIANQIKHSGYILTNKAIYFYEDATYKTIKRIAYDEVFVMERSEYIYDGFYIASKKDYIKVECVLNEKELFNKLAKKITEAQEEKTNN